MSSAPLGSNRGASAYQRHGALPPPCLWRNNSSTRSATSLAPSKASNNTQYAALLLDRMANQRLLGRQVGLDAISIPADAAVVANDFVELIAAICAVVGSVAHDPLDVRGIVAADAAVAQAAIPFPS